MKAGASTVVFILALFFVACSRGETREGLSKRIVSLSPSTTEALAAIGAREALVGRSRYCDYPSDVATLPEVGGYVDPNLEAILALRPDLVTGARGPAGSAITERLAAQRIATYFPETETLAEIDEMIRGLGARTGHDEEARRVVHGVHAREAAIAHAVEGSHRPRVLLIFGLEPIVAAGPESFAGEMLRAAGGENVLTNGGAYPTLGIERILALDPDAVVDAAMGESSGAERISMSAPGWRELRAVKAGHVVSLKDEVVLRPGPRVAEGLAVLARALHPEIGAP